MTGYMASPGRHTARAAAAAVAEEGGEEGGAAGGAAGEGSLSEVHLSCIYRAEIVQRSCRDRAEIVQRSFLAPRPPSLAAVVS